MSASIKIDFTAGTVIDEAFIEAIRLAQILKVTIEFKFNGVDCIAFSNSTVESGVKEYYQALKNNKFKIAIAKIST